MMLLIESAFAIISGDITSLTVPDKGICISREEDEKCREHDHDLEIQVFDHI